MKKIYLILPLFLSMTFFCTAQESGYKTVAIPFDGEKASQAMADISSVDVRFCEKEGGTIDYSLAAGDVKKLCYVITNFSDTDVKLNLGFVDGGFTNDQWKNKSCYPDGQISNFGQYVTGYENIINLPPRGEVQRFASLQFPDSFTGVRNGCLVYSLGGMPMSGKVSFTVLMRKAKFIDIHLTPSVPNSELKNTEHFLRIIIAIIVVGWFIKKKLYMRKTTPR